jgi:hypothetical protein
MMHSRRRTRPGICHAHAVAIAISTGSVTGTGSTGSTGGTSTTSTSTADRRVAFMFIQVALGREHLAAAAARVGRPAVFDDFVAAKKQGIKIIILFRDHW